MFVRISSNARIEDMMADPANGTLWQALAPLGIYVDRKWR
jgi:hypothetical protein